MEKINLNEYLAANEYPGRGIAVAKAPDGRQMFIGYFIMGRSENSRNRVFVTEGDGIRTQAFDPSKMVDPSLIIYSPVRVLDGRTIVTNGDQTDTIYELMDKQQTFEQALANSCNCTFALLAVRLGQGTMAEYARAYGLLDSQSLDGIKTAAGSYPLEFVGDPETGWSGIGQSTDLVCPYSMLRMVCAIANGGVLIEPKLINDGRESVAERFMDAATADKLHRMMSYNAATAYDAEHNFPGLNICAKTGTAEIDTQEKDNAWFIGFIDDDAYPFAVCVAVENAGTGGAVAAPIAQKIFARLAGK